MQRPHAGGRDLLPSHLRPSQALSQHVYTRHSPRDRQNPQRETETETWQKAQPSPAAFSPHGVCLGLEGRACSRDCETGASLVRFLNSHQEETHTRQYEQCIMGRDCAEKTSRTHCVTPTQGMQPCPDTEILAVS